jgi:hypothetical protein
MITSLLFNTTANNHDNQWEEDDLTPLVLSSYYHIVTLPGNLFFIRLCELRSVFQTKVPVSFEIVSRLFLRLWPTSSDRGKKKGVPISIFVHTIRV